MSKLALGTVQFGIDYGIANKVGQVDHFNSKKIIEIAKINNIKLLDTASFYGESEKILGKNDISKFKITTKIKNLVNNKILTRDFFENLIHTSLKNMNINKIYGVLFHSSENLKGKNGLNILKILNSIKLSGLIEKIGVSIYDPSELDFIEDLSMIDIIQVPLNIIDRRIIFSGWLDRLHDKNIEVHTRSTFLQGLLALPRNQIPQNFNKWAAKWDMWNKVLKNYNLSSIDLSLNYSLSIEKVKYVLVGVDSPIQLEKIILASKKKINREIIEKFDFMISNNKYLINPTLW